MFEKPQSFSVQFSHQRQLLADGIEVSTLEIAFGGRWRTVRVTNVVFPSSAVRENHTYFVMYIYIFNYVIKHLVKSVNEVK